MRFFRKTQPKTLTVQSVNKSCSKILGQKTYKNWIQMLNQGPNLWACYFPTETPFQDPNIISNSVLSLSWSIGTEQCRPKINESICLLSSGQGTFFCANMQRDIFLILEKQTIAISIAQRFLIKPTFLIKKSSEDFVRKSQVHTDGRKRQVLE